MTRSSNTAPDLHHTTRDAILQSALAIAAFDGWTTDSFAAAVKESGVDAGLAHLSCPREELDLIIHWSNQMDAQAEKTILETDIETMKVRDRVTLCVIARLEAIGPHEEAARRARARLLLPDAVTESAGLVWNSCDTVWRAIGDQSTDFNFYSKRAILSGVYGSTLSVWLGETDPDKPRAREFLANRIENVMQFEKAKWQFRKATANLPDLGSILGKMRYGFGPRV